MRTIIPFFTFHVERSYKIQTLWSLLFIAIALFAVGCKKDKLKSKYASLLQHQWAIKSTSQRFSIFGSYQGNWTTKQATPGAYREFTGEGAYIQSLYGMNVTAPYELMSDTIIIVRHPATLNTPYADPDTAFIQHIDDSLFVWHSRTFFTSTNYATLSESMDTLVR